MTSASEPRVLTATAVIPLDDEVGLGYFNRTLVNLHEALITGAMIERINQNGFPPYHLAKFREEVAGEVEATIQVQRVSYNSPLEVALAVEAMFGYIIRAVGVMSNLWGAFQGHRDNVSRYGVQRQITAQQLNMLSSVEGFDELSDADRAELADRIKQQVDLLAQIKSLSLDG